jgi:hypothetical protein
VIEHPDVLIEMNEISLRKFSKLVTPFGTIVYSSEKLPEHFAAAQAQVFCVPGSEIADRLGNHKSNEHGDAGRTSGIDAYDAERNRYAVLKMKVKNVKLLEVDYQAIDAGIECVRQQIAERLAAHAHEDELTPAS